MKYLFQNNFFFQNSGFWRTMWTSNWPNLPPFYIPHDQDWWQVGIYLRKNDMTLMYKPSLSFWFLLYFEHLPITSMLNVRASVPFVIEGVILLLLWALQLSQDIVLFQVLGVIKLPCSVQLKKDTLHYNLISRRHVFVLVRNKFSVRDLKYSRT